MILRHILRSAQIYLSLVVCCTACSPHDITGAYIASVPFSGIDPRFVGQEYQWRLTMDQDGSFSLFFELPIAIYTEEGIEIIGKGSGETKGQWKQYGARLLLTRESGSDSLGSLNTISFSFKNDRLVIQMRDGKAMILQGSDTLVLEKLTSNK